MMDRPEGQNEIDNGDVPRFQIEINNGEGQMGRLILVENDGIE